jgi:hypothetical protein
MTRVALSAEATAYYGEVAAALGDLPAPVRADLLDDVMSHLTEVAAEGTPLDLRLGAPDAYAADLRTAAGYPPPERFAVREVTPRIGRRLARAARSADRRLGPVLGYDSLTAAGQAVLPAWWVVRGYLVGMLIVGGLFGWRHGLVPRAESLNRYAPGTAVFIGCAIVGAAMLASIRVGRWSAGWRSEYRIVVWIATAVLVAVSLINLQVLDRSAREQMGVASGHSIDRTPILG